MEGVDVKRVPFKGLSGLRNTLRPERLQPGELSVATNVDADASGTLERRDGYSLTRALSGCTSSYASIDGQHLFVLEAGVLSVFDIDFNKTTLATGIVDEWLFWAEAPPYVYYAGSVSAGAIVGGNLHHPLRIPSPETPKVSRTQGNLPAGQYQITSVWRHDATGLESAAPVAAVIEIPDNSGISIEADSLEGYTTLLYVTEPNGTILYLFAESDSAVLSESDLLRLAHPLHDEQYVSNSLPEGVKSLCWHEGRLFAATGDDVSVIWYSQPFWPAMYNVSADFFLVDGKICSMASTTAGLLIVTDKALWLYTPEEALQQLTTYGGVLGYSVSRDREGLCYVWTVKGLLSFPPLTPITEAKVFVKPGVICSTAIVEKKGRKQAIILTDGGGSAYNPY